MNITQSWILRVNSLSARFRSLCEIGTRSKSQSASNSGKDQRARLGAPINDSSSGEASVSPRYYRSTNRNCVYLMVKVTSLLAVKLLTAAAATNIATPLQRTPHTSNQRFIAFSTERDANCCRLRSLQSNHILEMRLCAEDLLHRNLSHRSATTPNQSAKILKELRSSTVSDAAQTAAKAS